MTNDIQRENIFLQLLVTIGTVSITYLFRDHTLLQGPHNNKWKNGEILVSLKN
jgi:hypothetical protein